MQADSILGHSMPEANPLDFAEKNTKNILRCLMTKYKL